MKKIKKLMADWKRVYTAANGETALYELEAFGKKIGWQIPKTLQLWELS